MPIKVVIKRKMPKYTEEDLLVLIKEMRMLTNDQPGYISGETLKRMDKPGQSMVISTWHSLDAWNRWFQSKERSQIQTKIDSLLGYKTEFKVYSHE